MVEMDMVGVEWVVDGKLAQVGIAFVPVEEGVPK